MGWKKLLSEGSNGAIVISNTAATIEPAGDTRQRVALANKVALSVGIIVVGQ